MKREEQAKQACTNWVCNEHKDGDELRILDAYLSAVAWADAHPNWISVKDELPKHDTNENGLVSFPIVLVCLYDGYRDTSYYDDIGEEWGDYDGEVEYWMPMPKAPRKEVTNETRGFNA